MKSRRLRFLIAIAALAVAPLFGAPASMQQASKRAVEVEDVIAWRGLGSTVLSDDGAWFAYRLAPQEGDAEVVIRQARGGDKTMRFAIGEVPAAGATSAIAFSDDAKWVAFSTYTVRMREYFDHYPTGAPTPESMVTGVPRLRMDEHLKDRAKPKAPPKRITTTTQGAGR